MPKCKKCDNEVPKVYDCEHTEFEKYCEGCYTELHYYLTEKNSIEEIDKDDLENLGIRLPSI